MVLQSLDTALSLLEFFTLQQPEWGVRELAKSSGKHPAVVQRMLATMAGRQLLYQDAQTSRYRLGMRLYELGSVVSLQLRISDVVRPAMQKLSQLSGETVFLCWLHGHEVTCIEEVESQGPVRLSMRIGRRDPCHLGAFAKVILAFQEPDWIKATLAKPLEKTSDGKKINIRLLNQELEAIREQKWAYTEQEQVAGTCALALPIAQQGHVRGSLCIAALLHKYPDRALMKTMAALQAATADVEKSLSFVKVER